VFRGVDDPEAIRDLMLERLRRLRGAGLGDLDDARSRDGSAGRARLPGGAGTLDVLAALRDEARALRRSMQAALPDRQHP
jgi:hypothetical protein